MSANDFGHIAKDYDELFTNSKIGKFQRQLVYNALIDEGMLNTSKSVFEFNCGTGYDAQFFHDHGMKVIATDASKDMVAYAQSSRNDAIHFKTLKFEDIENEYIISDVVFSNFGGLNCIDFDELKSFLDSLSKLQHKGQISALVIMPSFCFMESLYYFFKLDFKNIFRRSKKEGVFANVDRQLVKTYYYSPGTLKQLLDSNYHIKLIRPVGLFVPPSYMEPFIQKRAWLFNMLRFFDNLMNRLSKLAFVADHYIIIAERK